jgi:hypothetical protein
LSEICADDDFILLKYNILNGNLTCYSIEFNQKALSEGFENVVCQTPFSNGEIHIPIPDFPAPKYYVKPDINYSFSIDFTFGDSIKTQSFNFDILYPSWVIEQKWNDVLALLNQYYNGGYLYTSYEWWLDGRKIENEIHSYIYIRGDENLKMGHEYRAFLTRKDENYGIFTCPILTEPHTDITFYPSVVGLASQFGVISKNVGKVSIISVTGIKISEYKLSANKEKIISAPRTAGVYILVFETQNGETETKKIVVK